MTNDQGVKLAEALMERKNHKTRLESLKQRLYRNVRVQEGESPAEEPADLWAQLTREIEQFVRIVTQINVANTRTRLPDGRTLATGSADKARIVWGADDDIDLHYNAVFREMLTHLVEDPRRITAGAHMLFMAKNLERIGDHCTNIAEFVYYQAVGDYLSEIERPKQNQV